MTQTKTQTQAEDPRDAIRAMVFAALKAQRVELALQPVVFAGVTKVAFQEGLIRLRDAKGRIVPASVFIDAVEDHSLGRQIDCAALRLGFEALRQDPSLRLSINLSPATIGCPNWASTFDTAVEADPTLADRLIIEVTERAAMDRPQAMRVFMDHLRLYGVSFALDDFGAGQTSFRYLRDFRFDLVKLDGQFCCNVARDPDSQALIRALTGLASHFEMFTVAEHVDRPEDAACLAALGVDCLQGYLFGAPALGPAQDLKISA